MIKTWVYKLVSISLLVSTSAWAESTTRWTLGASAQRAVEVAQEMKIAEGSIGKQIGERQQATAWPNPQISLQVDNKLGIEDAKGGYDVTQLSISQPLPFRRLQHQRKQAEAGLASSNALRKYQQLLLEYATAQRFHILQLAENKQQLAQKRLQQASRYQSAGQKNNANDPLIRYLSPLEKMRLDIVLQATKQNAETSEGEYNEAAASFKALLALPIEINLQLMPLTLATMPAELNVLQTTLQHHPLLDADRLALTSAEASVDVAKAQRYADPTISLYKGKDYLADQRESTTGIALSVEIPFWNQNTGRITQARATAYQAQAELDLKQRELQTRLHTSYLHLEHLIEQAEHYRKELLQPAENILALTNKGFASSELNILTLIDANNTYFDAQERYLELLQLGWLELAEVRQAAGQFLTSISTATYFDEVK